MDGENGSTRWADRSASDAVPPWSPVDPASGHAAAPSTWYPLLPAPGAIRTHPAPRPRTRPGPVVVAVAALVALLVAVGLAVPRLVLAGSGQRAVHPATGGPPAGTRTGGTDTPAARESAIAAVLARRGTAVVTDDLASWRSTQTADAKVPQFSRLRVLPVTAWAYRVLSARAGADGASETLDVRVHLRYDVDTADAIVHEHLTLRRVVAGWRVVGESTSDRRAQPWDLGALRVVHGTTSLVVGIDTPTSTLREYARLADASVPEVTAVWGRDWNRHPVIVVPRTVAQLGRALGRTAASLEGYAAVTTGEVGDGTGTGAGSGLRIWTNTPGMASLSALGREVVVRHEITHVATDAPGTPSVPLWLEEGFAEYVGYRGSGLALTDELLELVSAQRRGTAPTHLPTQEEFDGEQVDLAYEGADLACRLVAEAYGQKALVRLYRLTRSGAGSADANLDAALRRVTGSGTAAFESAWRARIRALAA